MLDVAIRRLDSTGSVEPGAVELGGRAAPPLPVTPALTAILPGGLRRGSTVTVTGSISLLLALLGAASADGAWCALVGFPRLSAEAAAEYGIELSRLAVVRPSGAGQPEAPAGWTTAVGALLDAVDIVAARPPVGTVAARPRRSTPGEVRRLAARARSRDAVLMPFVTSADEWPGADVRLNVHDGDWSGIGQGSGRLRARRVRVTAEGRGQAARPRSTQLWLPALGGGVAAAAPSAVAHRTVSLAPAVIATAVDRVIHRAG